MTDLEKLKELEAAVDGQLCDRNDLLGDDTLDDLFEVLGALPTLIAELEAAREVVEAVKVTHAISNRPGHEAWQRVEAALAHYQEVTK